MATPAAPRLLPWRFGLFLLLSATVPLLVLLAGLSWPKALMAGFNVAALGFFATLGPLFRAHADAMRRHSAENDANRLTMLGVAVAVSLVVLVAVGTEIADKTHLTPGAIALVVATLLIAWLFSNMVFTLHYAHLFYIAHDGDGEGTASGDSGGADFPATDQPLLWDFAYFAFTLGMTFQTSDVAMTNERWRRVALLHSFAAFVYNLGIVAFTINVIGGSG